MRRRRGPGIVILLDLIMTWVLVLLALPPPAPLRFALEALPPGAVLFQATLPLAPGASWAHFDFARSAWVGDPRIGPRGLQLFLCEECANFLPAPSAPGRQLVLGLPAVVGEQLRKALFDACRDGRCAGTLRIDAAGEVRLARE